MTQLRFRHLGGLGDHVAHNAQHAMQARGPLLRSALIVSMQGARSGRMPIQHFLYVVPASAAAFDWRRPRARKSFSDEGNPHRLVHKYSQLALDSENDRCRTSHAVT
jgi:hypothetical protein